MLIRRAQLEGIRRGDVSLAFRCWKRPTVKAGGTLHTALGLLAVDEVERVPEQVLTAAAARAAGFESLEALRGDLATGEGRALYRIRLRFLGEDPRIALRATATLDEEARRTLRARLARLDAASRRGPWTETVLATIREHPATLAAELAHGLGMERTWFKANVRKLKALGLTESLDVGYRLSPRGAAWSGRARPARRRRP